MNPHALVFYSFWVWKSRCFDDFDRFPFLRSAHVWDIILITSKISFLTRRVPRDSVGLFLSVICSFIPWHQDGNGKMLKQKLLPNSEPISKSVSELQPSLAKSDSSGSLSSCNVLLAIEPEQAELLDRCCFGRLVLTAEKVKKWIQLSFEEAFYFFYNLKCIKISLQGRYLENEAWLYMKSKRPNFPILFKAYSHLRSKNWVLRSGLQYGVDFVAYRHYPSLVHSEYSVLVQSGDSNDRLRVWSDIHCVVRLSGSVAKTLLSLHVSGNSNKDDLNLPMCLENYTVEEQTISRWSPELNRESETN